MRVPLLPLILSCYFILCYRTHSSWSCLDGVTVAKAITLKDKFENLGARYDFPFFCDAYIDFRAD